MLFEKVHFFRLLSERFTVNYCEEKTGLLLLCMSSAGSEEERLKGTDLCFGRERFRKSPTGVCMN